MKFEKGLIFVILASMFVALFYANIQRETIEPTKGAADYYWLYQKFKGETPDAEVRWPYNKRPGTPYVASLLPLQATVSFRTVNILSCLIAVIFSYLSLREIGLNKLGTFACLMPLAFFEWSPLRSTQMYPFHCDPPAIMLYAMAGYFIIRKNYATSAGLLAVACLFRESSFFYAITLGLMFFVLNRKSYGQSVLIFLICLSGAVLNYVFQVPLWCPTDAVLNTPTTYGTLAYSGNQFEVITYFLKYRLGPPHFGIIPSITAMLMCVAPFFVFLKPKTNYAELIKNPAVTISLAWLVAGALMSTFGGAETDRIFYAGYPLYLILLAYIIKDYSSWSVWGVIFVGLVTHSFLAVTTENSHWGWLPSLADSISHRHLPLTVTYTVFWCSVFILYQLTIRLSNRGQRS
jgi:hypothetical protein